jgi:soluble lytic murein transglycosylase
MIRFVVSLAVLVLVAPPVLAQSSVQDEGLVTRSLAEQTEAAERARAKEAITHYRRNNLAEGDLAASGLRSPALRIAAEWAAIRFAQQSLGFERLRSFARANPDFPMRAYLMRRMESALLVDNAAAGVSFDFFDARDPEQGSGRLQLARHLRAKGFEELAARQIRAAWRSLDVSPDIATLIIKEFDTALSESDHFYRAQRLVYAGQTGLGIRAASRISPDHVALMEELVLALRNKGSLRQIMDRVPPSMRKEPAFALMKAIDLRRADRHAEAARTLLAASRDPKLVVDGDAWWQEERALTRGLVDAGENELAYQVAAGARAMGPNARAESEFLAGFVALRKLGRPAAADMHFLRSLRSATDPAPRARALYWLGRSQQVLGLPAAEHFRAAARIGSTYYGQIAAATLGLAPAMAHAQAGKAARDDFNSRPEIAVLNAYLEIGERELAGQIALDIAGRTKNPADIAMLGELFEKDGASKLVLAIGRRGLARGFDVIDTAFPSAGIPPFEPAEGSAEAPLVFAVARQESAFDPRAVSHADARGLMQLLPSTARVTARRFKIPYSPSDLLDNPALNAKIGAAHLGELKEATRGNLPMMLAAYNAGPRRMREWIAAYGDPRDPATDPIDWVERIPFNETRGYIQKVMENHGVYRARLTPSDTRNILDDLREGRRLLEAALP